MKRSHTGRRRPPRLRSAGFRLVLSGFVLVLMPIFLGSSVAVGEAVRSLAPVGWALVAGGVALIWIAGRLPARVGAASRRPDAMTNPGRAPASGAEGADPPPARPTSWSAAVLEVIEWRRLEALVEALYRQAGFDTRAQSHGPDGGVDVWLHAPREPSRPVSVVQCKHHRKPVGVDKVRELRGAMAAHGVGRGQFVSTAGFSAEARTFARENGIHLLDGAALLTLIGKRPPAQQAELLALATEGEFWRPTCASCGVKMVRRLSRNRGAGFWGCVNYPGCRSTLRSPAGEPRTGRPAERA